MKRSRVEQRFNKALKDVEALKVMAKRNADEAARLMTENQEEIEKVLPGFIDDVTGMVKGGDLKGIKDKMTEFIEKSQKEKEEK